MMLPPVRSSLKVSNSRGKNFYDMENPFASGNDLPSPWVGIIFSSGSKFELSHPLSSHGHAFHGLSEIEP